MENIRIFQVDAFTDKMFRGNPAAVCLLTDWPDDLTMQLIGSENNLAETAFIIDRKDFYDIRWFTPTIEVELCGHATLASAYVVFNRLNFDRVRLVFRTRKNGDLFVLKKDDLFILDFPSDPCNPCDKRQSFTDGIGIMPLEMYESRYFYMAVLGNEEDVANLMPDFNVLAKLGKTGMIVTAPGRNADFVSRFFAPGAGINEDPVTGSAHTVLIPYWSERLARKELLAQQISKRGGTLYCTDHGERVHIAGRARLYMEGQIYI